MYQLQVVPFLPNALGACCEKVIAISRATTEAKGQKTFIDEKVLMAPMLAYLKLCRAKDVNVGCRQRAASLVVSATKTLVQAGGGEAQFEGPAWNNNTVMLIRAAKGHLQLVLFQTFADSVNSMEEKASPWSSILRETRILWSSFTLLNAASFVTH